MQTTKKYWFVRKPYGWGRVPASKEGRIVLGLYIILVIARTMWYSAVAQADKAMRAGTEQAYNAGGNAVIALVPVFLLTIMLLVICYKTGETPRRQWGKNK